MINDQEKLNLYLLLLKSNTEVYVHGTLESSNEEIRICLKESLDDTMTSQYSTYSLMVDNNWYSVNNIKTSDVSKVLKKVTQKSKK